MRPLVLTRRVRNAIVNALKVPHSGAVMPSNDEDLTDYPEVYFLMPVYTYRCEKCHGTFEVTQKIIEAPLKKCQLNGCRGAVKRVIHTPGVIFKGQGFHVNDYPDSRGRKKSDLAKPESEPASSSSGSEAKKDSKTETKSPKKSDSKSGKAA